MLRVRVPSLSPLLESTSAAAEFGVTAAIDNLRGEGAVKIGGVEWSARSADDTPIEKDAVVRVTKIEGVKVFVELVKEEAT